MDRSVLRIRKLTAAAVPVSSAWAAYSISASVQIAKEEAAAARPATIATVLPDSADKYRSERFWEEA